jgi:hypothetical protein
VGLAVVLAVVEFLVVEVVELVLTIAAVEVVAV